MIHSKEVMDRQEIIQKEIQKTITQYKKDIPVFNYQDIMNVLLMVKCAELELKIEKLESKLNKLIQC